MKRTKLSFLGAGVVACALAATIAGPAAADFVPQPQDVVGGGSDTTQFAMNFVADGADFGGSYNPGFNALAKYRLVSFDAILDLGDGEHESATNDGITLDRMLHNQIVPKAGQPAVTRPNGSGEGKNMLRGSGNNASFNYARSSSVLNATEVADDLWLIPFASDGIKLAVRAAGTSAPASITGAQMVGIYDGTYTNWSQLGGANAPIVAMIPQSGSGTRATFLSILDQLNGAPAFQLRPDAVVVQEHDAAPIAAEPNAVAPFSTGRAATATGIDLVEGVGSWSYVRALYNVVREADLTAPWFGEIFGSDGWICSGAGLPLIQASGFSQLAHPFDGGVCGEPTQTATANFTHN